MPNGRGVHQRHSKWVRHLSYRGLGGWSYHIAILISMSMKKQSTKKSSSPVSGYTTASKLFIIATLKHILHECEEISKQENFQGILHPFDDAFVCKCLNSARTYCIHNGHEELLYGPSKFDKDNTSTYWTESIQYFTWWKNFIERRAAFERLLELSQEKSGSDKRRQK